MPFSLVQGGTQLGIVTTAGAVTVLTLPSGVSFTTRYGRVAVLKGQAFLVNGPNRNLWIDQDYTVRTWGLLPPVTAPTLTGPSAGGYTGTVKARVTYYIKDQYGNLLAESAFSPISASVTVTAKLVRYSNIPISPSSDVTGRRLYRTATNGAVYFPLLDIDDNTTTAMDDDTSDVALALVAAATDLGTPPGSASGGRLELLVAWRNRLWGKSPTKPDDAFFSSDGKFYAWPADQFIPIEPTESDNTGITAFLPRRDELGISRLDRLAKVVGTDEDNFSLVNVVNGVGVQSHESVVIIRDTAYFLGADGVYSWANEGVTKLSRQTVDPWFTTDTYFNRALFTSACAYWNPKFDTYELLLASAGSSVLDRWVAYDLRRNAWLGPHKTGELTITYGGYVLDASLSHVPILGGTNGYLYTMNDALKRDGASTAIDYDVYTKYYSGNVPAFTHMWGELVVMNRKETVGTVTITPYVGDENADAQLPITTTLTKNRTRNRRLGVGAMCRLRLRKNTVNESCSINGVEIPFIELGER